VTGAGYVRFDEFGLPFYIVLGSEEKNDYDKIYDKIRRKYAQFSAAEELVDSTNAPKLQGLSADATTPDEDAMDEVIVTHQDPPPEMVTIRVQPYQKPAYVYGTDEVEMPTMVDNKVESLPDLRDFLRSPVARMESVAPSAMESVHQGPSTPPDSDPSEGFVDAMDGDVSA
jgi:hypothetical protein